MAEAVMPANASALGAATASRLGAAIPFVRCRDEIGWEFRAADMLGTAFLAVTVGALAAGSTGDSVITTVFLGDFTGIAAGVRFEAGGAEFGLATDGVVATCGGETWGG